MNSQSHDLLLKLQSLEAMRYDLSRNQPKTTHNQSNSLLGTSAEEYSAPPESIPSHGIIDLKERRKSVAKNRERVSSFSNDKGNEFHSVQDLDQNVDSLVSEWRHQRDFQSLPQRASIVDQRASLPFTSPPNQAIWELPEIMELATPIKNIRTEIEDNEDLLDDTENLFDNTFANAKPILSHGLAQQRVPVLSARNSQIPEPLHPITKQYSDQKLGTILKPSNPALKIRESSHQTTRSQMMGQHINLKTEPQISKTMSASTKIEKKPVQKGSPVHPKPTVSKSIKTLEIKQQQVPKTFQSLMKQQPQQLTAARKPAEVKSTKPSKDQLAKQQDFILLNAQFNKLKKDISTYYDKHLKHKKDNLIQLHMQLKQISDEIKQDIDTQD